MSNDGCALDSIFDHTDTSFCIFGNVKSGGKWAIYDYCYLMLLLRYRLWSLFFVILTLFDFFDFFFVFFHFFLIFVILICTVTNEETWMRKLYFCEKVYCHLETKKSPVVIISRFVFNTKIHKCTKRSLSCFRPI